LKTAIHLWVDADIVRFCKARGVNMSKEVERYLKGLMGMNIDALKPDDKKELIADLEQKLAKAQAEQAEFEAVREQELEEKKKAGLLKQLEVLRQLYYKKDVDRFAQKQYAELFEYSCRAFGLTRSQLLDYVEQRKVLK